MSSTPLFIRLDYTGGQEILVERNPFFVSIHSIVTVTRNPNGRVEVGFQACGVGNYTCGFVAPEHEHVFQHLFE